MQALSTSHAALWNEARANLLASRDWLQAFIDEARSPGERLRMFAVEDDEGRALGLVPGFTSRVYNAFRRARVLRFHQADGAVYAPVTAAGVDAGALLATVLDQACRMDPPNDSVRVGPLRYPSPTFDIALQALRARGFLVQRYLVFENRYENTEGMSSADYLASRDSKLRNTIGRRTRAFERGGGRFELVTDEDRLPAVFDDYDRVFAKSWKLGEHMVSVEYIRRIMRAAARAGALRLGLLYVDGQAVAAQFWLLNGNSAMCLRLAFMQRFARMSPGTVLTWRMLAHLLDEDRVDEIDFGIGDDPYKKDWMHDIRQNWGIDAFNPRTLRGLRCAVRHFLPPLVKPVLRPIWHRVRPWLDR